MSCGKSGSDPMTRLTMVLMLHGLKQSQLAKRMLVTMTAAPTFHLFFGFFVVDILYGNWLTQKQKCQ